MSHKVHLSYNEAKQIIEEGDVLLFKSPCPNLSDKRTSPADIAQSALFDYLFTIQ